jgi:hypothetical protein
MTQNIRLLPGTVIDAVPIDFPTVSNRQTYPIVTAHGRQFVVMPVEDYRNLKSNKTGWFVLAGAGGLGVVALVITLLYRPNPQPMVIEKPVIVERQVPVNKNCLLFCR